MRTAMIARSMAWATALTCAATLLPAVASADRDDDHEGGRHRHKKHHERVVYTQAPVCRAPVYVERRAPRVYVRDRDWGERGARYVRDRAYGYDRDVRYVRDRGCGYGRDVRYVGYREPVCYQPARYYYDPYCHERFSSLTLYFEHVQRHAHGTTAFAFSIGSAQPDYTCRYVDDRWVRYDVIDD